MTEVNMCQTPIVCQQCRESMPDIAWNHPCPHWRWTPENVAAIESEIILLKAKLASLYDDARCGHEQRFLQWENHSKPIICTLCEIESLKARLAETEARQFSVGAKHLRDYAERVKERDEACRCLQEALRYVPPGLSRERYELAAKGGRDEL